MEKKKYTPFQIAMLSVAVVAGGGLLALGVVQKGDFDNNQQEYESKVKELKKMESRSGYPNKETVASVKESLVSYKGNIEGVRSTFLKSTMDDFQEVSSSRFAELLGKANTDVRSLYSENKIALPENWHLGFEKYSTVPAPKEATGVLSYQLSGMRWLHEELAKHQPKELLNLYRKPVALESGSGDVEVNKATSVYVALPLELTFVATEANVRSFLNALISSDDYLFTIDTIQLKSLVMKNESQAQATAESEEDKSSGFSKLFEGSEGEAASPLSDDKLFDQVLGQELVTVLVDLNLNYLPAQMKLPEIK